MKESGMMSELHRLILHPLVGKIFLCLLASVYLVYLVAFGRFLSISLSVPAETVIEHPVKYKPRCHSQTLDHGEHEGCYRRRSADELYF